MEKNIKNVSILILIISLITLPFVGIGILFSLAGSGSGYINLIAWGYLGLIIFSAVSIFKYKFYPAIIISFILIITGAVLDADFWAEENNNLCLELRSNSTCVETACGFNCTDLYGDGIGFDTPGFICEDKDMSLCI